MGNTKIYSAALPFNVRQGDVLLILDEDQRPILIFPATSGLGISETDIVFMAQPMSEKKSGSDYLAFKSDGKMYILDRRDPKKPVVKQVENAEGSGEDELH